MKLYKNYNKEDHLLLIHLLLINLLIRHYLYHLYIVVKKLNQSIKNNRLNHIVLIPLMNNNNNNKLIIIIVRIKE